MECRAIRTRGAVMPDDAIERIRALRNGELKLLVGTPPLLSSARTASWHGLLLELHVTPAVYRVRKLRGPHPSSALLHCGSGGLRVAFGRTIASDHRRSGQHGLGTGRISGLDYGYSAAPRHITAGAPALGAISRSRVLGIQSLKVFASHHRHHLIAKTRLRRDILDWPQFFAPARVEIPVLAAWAPASIWPAASELLESPASLVRA